MGVRPRGRSRERNPAESAGSNHSPFYQSRSYFNRPVSARSGCPSNAVRITAVALEEYRRKRDFSQTPEPSGDTRPEDGRPTTEWDALRQGRRYCVQMHRATRMHFDFRLEHNGVLLSWAVPRGPSLDPKARRLAVHVEDHPVDYGDFEGVIPSGYGAGVVLLWDIGTYEWTRESAEDFDASFRKGDIKFRLSGQKLAGEFALVKIGERGRRYGGSSDGDKNWLLIKKRDEAAVEGYDALAYDVSVKTGRSLAQIAAESGVDPRELRRAASANRGRPAPREERVFPTPPKPMLATPVDRPFSGEGWFFELKYDGARAMVSIAGGAARIVGRSGRDETARYPELQAVARAVRARDAVIDGEIVVFDARGRTSFERLQSRINLSRAADIERGARDRPVAFAAFDIVELDGRDIMQTALRIRKKTLRDVLATSPGVLFADHIETDGEEFFRQVQRNGAEGIVAKRADSLYQPGRRSRDWLKIKAWHAQSCVIVGYTAGQGRRKEHLGALILAVQGPDGLVHCGQVGTGFDDKTLRMLLTELSNRRVEASPLQVTPRTAEPATWVRPELVCAVRHAGWTCAGILRPPAALGLRTDLTPADCVREQDESTEAVLRNTSTDGHDAGDAAGGSAAGRPGASQAHSRSRSRAGRTRAAGGEGSP